LPQPATKNAPKQAGDNMASRILHKAPAFDTCTDVLSVLSVPKIISTFATIYFN
jgi:hypothetical protein